jgi:Flp pilus assembly protein TadG
MLSRMLQLLTKNEEGSALIEGAIVVPVLCVLLFGVYEFSVSHAERVIGPG